MSNHQKFLDVNGISLSSSGNVVLSDSELEQIEGEFNSLAAGGGGIFCPQSPCDVNLGTNTNCDGTSNDACRNTLSCRRTTNEICTNTSPTLCKGSN
jgi:hypothetical protein